MADKMKVSKALVTILTIAALIVGVASSASATEFVGTGSITILNSLSVSEESGVDFGYIHRPSVGSNTFTLDHASGSLTSEGTGDAQAVEGTSANGVYMISGVPEQTVQVSVSMVDFADPGITVKEAHVNGPTDTVSGNLDDSGKYAAQVGGVVTIDSNASLGTHTTDVVVTVAYE